MNLKRICFTVWILLSVAITAQAEEFSVTSPQLEAGGRLTQDQLLNGFGCEGKNISPALHWQNGPENTKSYAVTVYDPDAPTGSGWWHWVIFNIPPEVTTLALDAGNQQSGLAPIGSVQSRTDFGTTGYGGACPPQGDKNHRYIFSVYALDTKKLDLDKDATAAMVGFFIRQHTIAKTELKVVYSR
jgi:Raf kinase inhibitor-like YbhB/YbcL family protein